MSAYFASWPWSLLTEISEREGKTERENPSSIFRLLVLGFSNRSFSIRGGNGKPQEVTESCNLLLLLLILLLLSPLNLSKILFFSTFLPIFFKKHKVHSLIKPLKPKGTFDHNSRASSLTPTSLFFPKFPSDFPTFSPSFPRKTFHTITFSRFPNRPNKLSPPTLRLSH